jgi:PAS domain S-box-containing protein
MNYKYLFNNIADAILVYDLDGNFIDCNESALHLLGYSHQEMENIRPQDIVHPDYHELMRNNQQRIKAGETTIVESVHISRDGVNIPVEIKTTCIEVEEKKIMVAVIRDIRDSKKLEAIIKEQSSRMEALLRTQTEGLWVVNKTGKLLIVNDAYCSMSGYTREEIMKLSIPQLEAQETPEEVEKHIKKIIERGWDKFESKHRRKDGTIYDVEISISFDKIRGEFYGYVNEITEEKRIKRELKKFMETVEYSTDAIGMSTPEGRHYYQNEAFDKLFGDVGDYPPSSLYVDEKIGNEVFAMIMVGKPWAGEVKMYTADKKVVDILLRAYPVFDEEGNISALVGVHTDITEQKIKENVLKTSEALLNKAQQITQMGSWILDLDTNHLSWSDEIYRIFEIDPQEFGASYEAFLNAIQPDDREAVNKAYTASVENKSRYSIEHRLLMRDGRIKYVEEQGETIYDSNGKPLRSIGTVHDITERVKTTETLKASEDLLRRSQQIAQMGSWNLNATTQNLIWTDETYNIFGMRPQECAVTQEMFFEMVHPDDREAVGAAFITSTEAGQNIFEIEHRVIRRNTSEIRYVLERCEHIRDASGKLVHSIGMVQDITERKRAEKALDASKRRLDHLLSKSPSITYSADIAAGFSTTFISSNLTQLLGYSPEEFIRETGFWMEHIHPEDAERVSAGMDLLFKKDAQVLEYRFRHKDGHYVWMQDNLNLMRAAADNPLEIIGSWIDITERRRLEEKLGVFAQAMETSSNPFILVDMEGVITYCNRATEELYEYERGELMGTHISALDADPQHQKDVIIPAIQNFGRWSGEVYGRKKDGSLLPEWLATTIIIDNAGKPIGILGIVQDITERVEKDKALVESEKKLRELYNAMMIGFVRVDMQGKFVEFNKTFEAMLGYSAEELSQLSFPEITPPQWHESDLAVINTQLIPRGYSDLFEKEFIKKDGSTIAVAVQGAFSKNEAGEPAGIWAWVQDITEHKFADDALQNAEARYRLLFEQSPYGVVLLDMGTGQTMATNEVAYKQLGYTREEFMTLRISDYEVIEKPEETVQHLKKVMTEGTDDFETLHRTKSGEIKNIHVWSKAIQLGNHALAYSIFQDITERRQAEQKYKNILETAIDGFWTVDNRGRLLEANDAYARMSGYSRDELKGMNILDFEAIMNRDEIEKNIAKIIELGSARFTTKHRHKNGTIFDVEVSTQYSNAEGGIFISFLQDITERKRVEEDLRIKENAIATSTNGIMIARADGAILYVNLAFIQMWKYAEGDDFARISPNSLWDYPLELREQVIETLIKTGGWVGESIGTRKDGSQFPVLLSSSLIKDAAGNPQYIMGSFVDITARKRAEEELSQSRSRLERVMESINDGFFILDKDWHYIYVNNTAAASGYTTKEALLGKSILEIAPGMENSDFHRACLSVKERGTTDSKLDINYDYGNLPSKWYNYSISPFEGGVAVHFRDVTRHKLAEQQIKASLHEKEILLKEIHHRVKNNLQIVGSLIYLQSLQIKNDKTARLFRESLDRIKAMSLIHEFLYQSKDLKNVNVKDYVTGLVFTLKESYLEKENKIEIEFYINAEIDIDRLIYCGLIINELVSNAFKYAFKEIQDGKLTINFEKQDSEYILAVSDNGCGIADVALALDGKSLGLKIVDTLTKQLKGSIQYKNDSGTTVEIKFPFL